MTSHDRGLAYVVATVVSDDAKVDSSYPRAEFRVLSERYGVPLIGFDQPEIAQGRLARKLGRPVGSNFSLARVTARRHAYDSYIVSGEDIGLPLALALRARGDAAEVNIITHGSYFGSTKFRHAMRAMRSLRNVRFLCLAESLERALVERFGVPRDAVLTLGYGVDTQFFTAMPRPPASAAPIIASAGLANRDYATLAEAAGDLDVDIRIAADSAWHPYALEQPKTGANIEMRSYGTYAALRDLYAEAAIVVIPLHEARHACGYAVALEAMAMGRTVVLTRTEAPPDFLVDGSTGCFVEPGDVEGLRKVLADLLDDPQRCDRMGRAAHDLVSESFSLDSYVDRLYETVSGPRPPQAPASRWRRPSWRGDA